MEKSWLKDMILYGILYIGSAVVGALLLLLSLLIFVVDMFCRRLQKRQGKKTINCRKYKQGKYKENTREYERDTGELKRKGQFGKNP